MQNYLTVVQLLFYAYRIASAGTLREGKKMCVEMCIQLSTGEGELT